MLWFLSLTQRCNLNCTYCGNGETFDIEDAPHPVEISYNFLEACRKIAAQDREAVVCFYGGEPLLKMTLMLKAVRLFRGINPAVRFVLQTNGTFLKGMKDELLAAVGTILVSVDGTEEHTDACRGSGTYRKVIAGVEAIRSRGYNGDLIARMTVSRHSDIYRDVTHLLSLQLFDHIHWQLDALFDAPMRADFLSWRDDNYGPGMARLAADFLAGLQQGRVLPLVPFLGLLRDGLQAGGMDKVKTALRCGSGVDSFSVTTAGKVVVCPTTPMWDGCIVDENILAVGDVQQLPCTCKARIAGPCKGCDILDVCGGRCLVANKTLLWGGDGFDAVCATIRQLLELATELLPHVQAAVEAGRVERAAVCYPPFNNSTEIIP
eukprot:EG_transcript_11002